MCACRVCLQLEDELLQGQKLQGPQTAQEVYELLQDRKHLDKFPLFVATHKILLREIRPEALFDYLRNEPDDQME